MLKVSIIHPLEKNFDRLSKLLIMPRYGTIAIATAIKNAGYEVRVFSEFIRTEIDYDYVYSSDIICFALMTFCSKKGYRIAQEIRQKTNVPIIFGGEHPTVLPEECLKYCDYVVRAEGDETIVELLDTLKNKKDVSSIKGISYKNSFGEIIHNPTREFMEHIDVPQDISLMHGYDTIATKTFGRKPVMNLQAVQTSRGCPFNCKFCVAPKELGTKYRTKSIDTVLKDIENGIRIAQSNAFIIVDNEFTINRERTKKLLKALIDKYEGALHLLVFARTEIAQETEILQLMKKAGVDFLFLGIESINDETLKFFNKNQTLKKVKTNVAKIHEAGIYTMGATILGSDYDTPDKIENTADFFIENNFYHANFYSLYEIPTKQKTVGYPQIFSDNRFIHHDWRFYNSTFVIHYPKNMKPSTLQQIIINNYNKFYSLKYRMPDDPFKGTGYSRVAFKLFMINPDLQLAERYISFLKEFEEGLYDKNERLIEDRLPKVDGNMHLKKDILIDLNNF